MSKLITKVELHIVYNEGDQHPLRWDWQSMVDRGCVWNAASTMETKPYCGECPEPCERPCEAS